MINSLSRRMPIRIRLTLWYSIVIAATLFTIGFTSLWMVHRAIDDLENNELQQRVRSVRRFVESRPANETFAQLHDAITAAYDVSHGNKWLQVIDDQGNWIYRSPHIAAIYPTLVRPQRVPEEGYYFTFTADALYVRALIEPITVHGVRYTVQTGLTLNKTLAILSNFRIQFSILTTVGLLISSFAGYFMSRKALTPIVAIASEAQRINDKNLNSRLPILETHDELASLSNTLNQMLSRIEAGFQSVRSFTANAAHELRSPVALLRAETEVALAFPRDAGYYRNTCEHVLRNSIQMTHLIDQLLALARADAGVEVLRFNPVNLPDLIEDVAYEWVERFGEAQIQFKREIATLEFWVEGDYMALKRLLNILLENAWRYTPPGQSVTLSLCEQERQPGFVTSKISVSDTGVGVSREDQNRIFDRFCRVARPLRGDFSGSGLGLALAQWIAKSHHASIELCSSLGEGSQFSFFLQRMNSEQKPRVAEAETLKASSCL
jgi:signal transduction histidine kinase